MLLLVAESHEGFNEGDFTTQGLTVLRGIERQGDELGHQGSLGRLQLHGAWNVGFGDGPSVQLSFDLEVIDGVVKAADFLLETLLIKGGRGAADLAVQVLVPDIIRMAGGGMKGMEAEVVKPTSVTVTPSALGRCASIPLTAP